MTIWKGRPKRQPSGAKYWPWRKNRKSELGRDPTPSSIGETEYKKKQRMKGGKLMTYSVRVTHANVFEGGKASKVKILDVEKNTANRHFVRQDIVTKGAIIKTDKGLAKVTSRPSREGIVNAVLVK